MRKIFEPLCENQVVLYYKTLLAPYLFYVAFLGFKCQSKIDKIIIFYFIL